MAKLNKTVKRFIVIELACSRTPTEIAAAVKETFAVEMDRQQVHAYNPLGSRGHEVAAK